MSAGADRSWWGLIVPRAGRGHAGRPSREVARGVLRILAIASLLLVVFAAPSVAAHGATSTKVSIKASPRSATIYRKAAVSGTLRTGADRPIAGRTLRLESLSSTGWTLVKKARTNSKGRVEIKVRPASDTTYRYRYGGGSGYAPCVSATRVVGGYTVPDQSFSGSGSRVIGPFTLEKGLAVFDIASASTEGYFGVWLLDSNGAEVALLANSIETFSGSWAAAAETTGDYYMQVTGDTTWSIVARQPRQLSAPATRSFSGSGATATELFSLPKGACTFAWTCAGTDYFGVELLDRDGHWVDLVANDVDSSSGSSMVSSPASGQYLLCVDAAGPWTLTCAPQ